VRGSGRHDQTDGWLEMVRREMIVQDWKVPARAPVGGNDCHCCWAVRRSVAPSHHHPRLSCFVSRCYFDYRRGMVVGRIVQCQLVGRLNPCYRRDGWA